MKKSGILERLGIMQVDGARETKDGIDVVPVVQTRELLLEDEKEEEDKGAHLKDQKISSMIK